MRADRLLAIMLRLHARGTLTAQTLATELEVSRRTILRDISALGMAGIPIYAEGGHGGGIHLDPAYRVNLTGLKETEAAALMRAVKGLPSARNGQEEAAELGGLKLLAALPAQQRQAVQRVQQRVHLDPTSWWQAQSRQPSLETLEQAIFDERRLRIRYKRRDATLSESTIEPYGLVDKASIWYLVARRDGEWRTYRADRLQDVVLLDETFERQEPFDLADYWQTQREEFESSAHRFHCTLLIVQTGMPLLERYAAGRFEIAEGQEQPEQEWVRIILHLTSSEEACMLLWGFGSQAQIIEPQSLRDMMLSRAQLVLSLHGSSS